MLRILSCEKCDTHYSIQTKLNKAMSITIISNTSICQSNEDSRRTLQKAQSHCKNFRQSGAEINDSTHKIEKKTYF